MNIHLKWISFFMFFLRRSSQEGVVTTFLELHDNINKTCRTSLQAFCQRFVVLGQDVSGNKYNVYSIHAGIQLSLDDASILILLYSVLFFCFCFFFTWKVNFLCNVYL